MGMVKQTLTDRRLKSLKRDRKLEDKLGHFDTWDSIVPGLGVRTSATGRRTFVLMARYPGSRHPTRRALGVYGELSLEQARTKARHWLELIRKGSDPAIAEEEKRQDALRLQANTFAAVAEDYLRLEVIGPDPDRPRHRKGANLVRDFRNVFIALWGERPISAITRRDVLALIESIRDNGAVATMAAYGKGVKVDRKPKPAPVRARNLLAHLKAFFNWAIERDTYCIESSPCQHIKAGRIIGERRSEDRTLNNTELFAFWRATGRTNYPYGPFYRLLLLTGLRLNEVADAAWNEFDLANRLWTIPASRMKGKNGTARPHSVPLTADILAILANLPRFDRGEYLFSARDGARPIWGSDRAKQRLDVRMLRTLRALARQRGEDPSKVKLPAWVNHDLRRTLRSRLSELRVNADVAEAILAHVKPGIRGVYDRYEYMDEKRHALELWATRLRSLVQPQPNVVELAHRR
jgi:integrase